MTKTEMREVADGLGRLLDAIERGDLDASPAYIARLEGAAAALEAIAAPAAGGSVPGGRAMSDAYSEAEWVDAAGHGPLEGLDFMDCYLLHERWIWANRVKLCFQRALHEDGSSAWSDTGDPILSADSWLFMYLWYGLLWAVIEAVVEDRHVDLRGRLAADVAHISDALRLTRNAVLHVPESGAEHQGFTRGGPHDERLTRLMRRDDDFTRDPETVPAIYRVHSGLGRLLLEESRRRSAAGSQPAGEDVGGV